MDLYIKEQFTDLFGPKMYQTIINTLMTVLDVEKNIPEILKFLEEIKSLQQKGIFGKITAENLTDDIEYYQRIKLSIYKKSGVNFPFHRSYIILNHNAFAPKREETESVETSLVHDDDDVGDDEDDFVIPDGYL